MNAPFETAAALEGIAHGFFGRRGGVSEGEFASLNVSTRMGDDPSAVAANRARACAALGLSESRLVLLAQVHSNRVVTLDGRDGGDVEADAMVTDRPGLVLGILTADCAPVLLADPRAGVVGAAHAGWRGADDGIIANTVAAMVRLGADPARIVAAVGPTIGRQEYEVGPEFRAHLLARHPGGARHFHSGPSGRDHFDLPGFVAERLAEAGIGEVARVPHCTCADPERYFSHRFATRAGTATGRQIALIARA